MRFTPRSSTELLTTQPGFKKRSARISFSLKTVFPDTDVAPSLYCEPSTIGTVRYAHRLTDGSAFAAASSAFFFAFFWALSAFRRSFAVIVAGLRPGGGGGGGGAGGGGG